ncbi:MAG: hypothetical protein JWQ90_5145 [Hydrocarboniphaga sp.]|uniref:hypothetical protein n=1 Tax=Hydrocarboniphaga sp. TaxID=2033016 RepID=UPI00261FE4EF|nr:hypothetical protein [Hydrocarboniphaga sp.]MDB5972695.1 hypothetical protein [Hydrocarboniphaga sp.]
MGMLKRWRERIDKRGADHRLADGDATLPERFAFSAAIPAGSFGSLCRVDLQLLREPQQDGERMHLRAHFQTNFASVLRPALLQAAGAMADEPSASRAIEPAGRAARIAHAGLQKVLATRLVQRVAAPLLTHDFNTWMEIQASTEPLDDGAHSLVPQQERLAAMGIQPARGIGPQAENWSSQTPNGYAQLSLLQVDKSHLPPELAKHFGKQPFQLAAAIVNTVERK